MDQCGDATKDCVAMDDFIYGEPQPVGTDFVVQGSDPAAISSTVDLFKAALGPAVAPTPENSPDGHRSINWDAKAPTRAVSDDVNGTFPGDFFNTNFFPRARGVNMVTQGTGMRLSSFADSGEPTLFGVSSEFQDFSPERLFGVTGGSVVELEFRDPANPTLPAVVDGFGSVFTGVDQASLTFIEYFDVGGSLIHTVVAPVSTPGGGLSFAGATFQQPVVARVRITAGNAGVDQCNVDTKDCVAMDDFIYGEPQPVGTDFVVQGSDPAAISSTVDLFKAALGPAVAPTPENSPDGHRSINWDAKAPTRAVSDDVNGTFPGDFFNTNFSPRARGVNMVTQGTGMRLSSFADSGEPTLFGEPGEFQDFSPERLFGVTGGSVVELEFRDPANPALPAVVDGFGSVFAGVDQASLTFIEYFDVGGSLIHTVVAPVSTPGGGLSFAGATFQQPVVARVRITAGNAGVDQCGDATKDCVAMDDFIYGEPQPVGTDFVVQGSDPAAISSTVDLFKAALGPAVAPTPENSPDGHRSINWDAKAPTRAVSDDVNGTFPGDFFNTNFFPRARGVNMVTQGTGMRLSSFADSGEPTLFGVSSEFQDFSPERLFGVTGGSVVELEFRDPANPTLPAVVDGFGSVFTGVDQADLTFIEYFDVGGSLIHTVVAPVSTPGGGLSFAGATFQQPVVARVRITAGNAGVDQCNVDTKDCVAMDDFIYGEPQPVGTDFVVQGSDPAAISSTVDLFKAALGPFVAPTPENSPDGHRSINWDAKAPTRAVSDDVNGTFPGDFFNTNFFPRARGVNMVTQGTGMRLSSFADSGEPTLFGVSSEFQDFSPERLFGVTGGSVVELEFRDPANPTLPAVVDGFGSVFTGVDQASLTFIEYFDVGGSLIHTVVAPVSTPGGGLSFAGATFQQPVVARVRITAGNAGVDQCNVDTKDCVAMDDFIYGEPQPVGTNFVVQGSDPAAISSTVDLFKAALGPAVLPTPENSPDGHRSINWDAKAATRAVSDDVNGTFPGDFFNTNFFPRARGVNMVTQGTGMRLSSFADSGEPTLFGEPGEFQDFSPSGCLE